MTPETARILTEGTHQCNAQVAAAAKRERGFARADVTLEQRKRKIDQEAFDQRLALLQRQLDEAYVWYRQPEVVAAGTVVLLVGVILLARETILDVKVVDRR